MLGGCDDDTDVMASQSCAGMITEILLFEHYLGSHSSFEHPQFCNDRELLSRYWLRRLQEHGCPCRLGPSTFVIS